MSEKKTFEDKMEQLDKMVMQLESGETGLEESVKILEKASKLIKSLEKELVDVEQKIKILNVDTGNITDVADGEQV